MMYDSLYAMSAESLRGYGVAAKELIRAPRNLGVMKDPDAVGYASAYHCRGRIEVQLKVDRERKVVKEARYAASGCPAITAALSLVTEQVRNQRIKEVLQLDWCETLLLLGAVPTESEGCVRAAVAAVREAAYDYLERIATNETVPGIPSARFDKAFARFRLGPERK